MSDYEKELELEAKERELKEKEKELNVLAKAITDSKTITVKSKNSKDSKKMLDSRGGILLPLKLIYEPLGNDFYCFNKNGKKGVQKAMYDKDIKKHFIVIDEEYYYFKDKPLKQVLFQVPDDDLLEKWKKDETPKFSNKEIFEKVLNFFKVCIDTVEEYHLLNPALAVLQSWRQPILNQVFYVGFEAKWGGGKTKALEGFSSIAYHGYLLSDTSQSAMVRALEQQGLTIAVDELDVIGNTKGRDSDLYKSFRQGYRKGNYFLRVNPNNFSEFDKADGFGTKAFTFVNDVEGALQQRSLVTSLRPTNDKRLAIIDMYIKDFGKNLFEKIFCWHMDSVESLPFLPSLPYLPHTLTGDVDVNKIRQNLYEQIVKDFSKDQRTFLEKFTGRNSELSYNVVLLSKIFEIDILDRIDKCMLEKEESDKGFNDNVLMDILKKTLVDLYDRQSHNYRLEKGCFKGFFYYPKNFVQEQYRSELKSKDYHMVSSSKFKALLKEVGFLMNVNIKRQKFESTNPSCLIYDNPVLKELGLESVEERIIGGCL